jgi:hypothetical protein
VKIRLEAVMALSGPSARTRSPAQNHASPPGPKKSHGSHLPAIRHAILELFARLTAAAMPALSKMDLQRAAT